MYLNEKMRGAADARATHCATTIAGPAPTDAPHFQTETPPGPARWAIAADLATTHNPAPIVAYEPLRESRMMRMICALVQPPPKPSRVSCPMWGAEAGWAVNEAASQGDADTG